MNPIQTNKPVFFGNNGEVLKNGYIYIGQPNQDPVPTANRKTVTFQDTSGTQFTAQQPLRTGVDGRIVYQATGKPIIALVDGNYSMLIQDENQVIIKNGYTPFVANSASTAGSEAVIYRSTLVDLKAYNGTPGDYVENVGKVTATDGEGARWLVVSNTGSPGDDIDLIDFDNGTQGVRVENQLYNNKRLGEIAAAGTTAQEEAKSNLSLFTDAYQTDTVDITTPGSWDAGSEIFLERIGKRVTITTIGILSHASTGGPTTAAGVIPAAFRPTTEDVSVVYDGNSFLGLCRVTSTGVFNVIYRDFTGAGVNRTDTNRVVSITYSITP